MLNWTHNQIGNWDKQHLLVSLGLLTVQNSFTIFLGAIPPSNRGSRIELNHSQLDKGASSYIRVSIFSKSCNTNFEPPPHQIPKVTYEVNTLGHQFNELRLKGPPFTTWVSPKSNLSWVQYGQLATQENS